MSKIAIIDSQVLLHRPGPIRQCLAFYCKFVDFCPRQSQESKKIDRINGSYDDLIHDAVLIFGKINTSGQSTALQIPIARSQF